MKRHLIVLLTLFGISLAQGAASNSNEAVSAIDAGAVTGVLPQNLIMLLDAGQESSVGDGFLSFYLALAVNHKIAPIIVSDTVLFAYLNAYKDLVQRGFLNDWQVFKHNDAGLFVLIPQPYLDSQLRLYQELQQPESNVIGSAVYSERELALGLAIDHANIMHHIDSSYDALLSVVSESVEDKSGLHTLLRPDRQVPLDAVLQLFVQGNENPGRLNILLSGHGFFEPTQDEHTAYWQTYINQLKAFSQDILELPQGVATQEEIQRKFAELNRGFIKEQLAEKKNMFDPKAEDIIKFLYAPIGGMMRNRERALTRAVYEDMAEKALGAFSQAMTAQPEAYIAGLSKKQFIDLLEFLKNKVNTSFLYYTTCFGGGVNLATVEEYLNKQESEVAKKTNPNFIIAAGAVSDSTVYATFFQKDLEKIHAGEMLQGKYNFSLFFDLLRKFFADSGAFKQDPFKEILFAMRYPQPETDSNMKYFTQAPSVYFPGAGIFRALEIDDDIKVLTNAFVKAREAEDGLIDARDKHAVLFYPQDVRVPILLGKKDKRRVLPAFVSMIPGPAVHHIKEIIAPGIDYDDFIWYAFAQNDSAYPKTWIVDSLLLSRFGDYADELLRKVQLFNRAKEYFEKHGKPYSETIPAPPGADEKQMYIENLIVQPAQITRSLSGAGDITTVWNVMFKDPVRDVYYIGTIDNSRPLSNITQYEKRYLTDKQAKALRNELFNLPKEAYEFKPSETAFEIGALERVLKRRSMEIKAQQPSSSGSVGN